jgi:hypothetical protein
MASLRARLRYSLAAQAADEGVDGLRVLSDSHGHSLLMKMWKDYISDEDFSRFPSFSLEVDRMLIRYGAKPAKTNGSDEQETSEDESAE